MAVYPVSSQGYSHFTLTLVDSADAHLSTPEIPSSIRIDPYAQVVWQQLVSEDRSRINTCRGVS